MTRLLDAHAMKALVGGVIGKSEWIEISQNSINKFADVTGDFQPIHVDAVAAAKTPLGGTVAHGFLTLSLMPMMIERSDCPKAAGVRMALNYGMNKTRFLAPVHAGKRVRGVFTLIALEEKRPGQWQQTLEVTVEIQGETRPALICEWISQFFV